jgi:uncharacterized protein YuzE
MDMKPEIEFDTELDTCYITLSKNDVYSTKQIKTNLIIDLDVEGFIVGIECLSVGLQLPYDKFKSEYGMTEYQEDFLKNYLKW